MGGKGEIENQPVHGGEEVGFRAGRTGGSMGRSRRPQPQPTIAIAYMF